MFNFCHISYTWVVHGTGYFESHIEHIAISKYL